MYAACRKRWRSADSRLAPSYYAGGPVAGKVFCIIIAVDMLFLYLLEWLSPTASIDCVPDALDVELTENSAAP